MSEDLIIQKCSPTLAGLKTANLFQIEFKGEEELRNEIRELNRFFAPKGLRVIPVKHSEKKALIYMYRPSHLERDLHDEEACRLLEEMGYCGKSCGQCIAKLIGKVRNSAEFPHEIGLFLGYPPEDVRGFIENNASNYKMVGTWKVYGDVNKAKETFCRFKKCTRLYMEQHRKGKSIERLTVAV